MLILRLLLWAFLLPLLRQLTSFALRVSKEGPFVTDGPQGTGDVVCGRRGLGT